MAGSSTPTNLDAVIDALDIHWWQHAIACTDTNLRTRVDAVINGDANSSTLPAAAAARLAAAGLIDAAGDPRRSVKDAAATAAQAEETRPSHEAPPVPAVFRGTLDDVRTALAARRSLSSNDAINGLASRNSSEQLQLLKPVNSRLSTNQAAQLVAAAARGTLTVTPADIFAARPRGDIHAISQQAARAVKHDSIDTQVAVYTAVLEQGMHLYSDDINPDARNELARSTTHLRGDPLRAAVAALIVSGTGIEHLTAHLAALNPTGRAYCVTVAGNAGRDDIAQALVAAMTWEHLANYSPFTIKSILKLCGPSLTTAQLDAIAATAAPATITDLYLGDRYVEPHPGFADTIDTVCNRADIDDVMAALTTVLRLDSPNKKRRTKTTNVAGIALLRAWIRHGHWRNCWALSATHPIAAAAVAAELSDAWARSNEAGRSVGTAAMNLCLNAIDDFDGTLDELVPTATAMAGTT